MSKTLLLRHQEIHSTTDVAKLLQMFIKVLQYLKFVILFHNQVFQLFEWTSCYFMTHFLLSCVLCTLLLKFKIFVKLQPESVFTSQLLPLVQTYSWLI